MINERIYWSCRDKIRAETLDISSKNFPRKIFLSLRSNRDALFLEREHLKRRNLKKCHFSSLFGRFFTDLYLKFFQKFFGSFLVAVLQRLRHVSQSQTLLLKRIFHFLSQTSNSALFQDFIFPIAPLWVKEEQLKFKDCHYVKGIILRHLVLFPIVF